MQKKLFTQIRNEWRGNLWLALELLVVSVVMWYIIDMSRGASTPNTATSWRWAC